MKKSILITASFVCILFSYQVWSQTAPTAIFIDRYDGPGSGSDQVRGMSKDAQGNFYVTGPSTGSKSGNVDYVTIKYNAAGQRQWVARYNGTGNGEDWSNAVTADAKGFVYVTGRSAGVNSNLDIVTVKYNGASGTLVWAARYNGTQNTIDVGLDVKVSAAGNIYVTGFSNGVNASTGYTTTTIMYDQNGTQNWVGNYDQFPNISGGQQERGNSLALDADGNAYVAAYNYALKYDISGNLVWHTTTKGNGVKARLDVNNNVLIAGWGFTAKLDPLIGTENWDNAVPQTFYDMTLDNVGNLYAVGYTHDSYGHEDIVTAKFNTNGVQQWIQTYGGTYHGIDFGRAIDLDASGNVYIAGQSNENDGSRNGVNDFCTIKYDNAGNRQWVGLYAGQQVANDAWGIVADAAGNVFVSGASASKTTNYDITTIRYASSSATARTEAVAMADPNTKLASTFQLNNFPNPCHNKTVIEFRLPAKGKVTLSVFDLHGKQITTLLDGIKEAGNYKIDFQVNSLAAGAYMYRLQYNDIIETRRIVIAK